MQLDSCPSPQELAAFAAAGLDPKQRSAVEVHLEACAACATAGSALIGGLRSHPGAGSHAAPDEEHLTAFAPHRYKLHRLVGSGGMGLVYEAEEVHTGRRVALKMAREVEGTPSAVLRHRFFREARVAAFLQHPNIVPVFDISEFPDGVPYYTQRLIAGRSLGSVIAACQGPRERIALLRNFLELCGAIAYAHGRGVIHRDLKPSNVIIGNAGETWVIDWGLARLRPAARPLTLLPGTQTGDEVFEGLRSDPLLTAVGTAVGTPAYMSPEQARGELELVDERSDVWSLGILLFEILAGETAYQGIKAKEILRRLREGAGPRLPKKILKEVPAEVAAIVAKALDVERGGRYPSAVELAADINSWMIGSAVSAHQYGVAERLRRWVRQHAALSLAMVVAAVVGGAWGLTLRAANLRMRQQRADQLFHLGQLAVNTLMFDRAAVDFAGALALDETRTGARIGLAATGDRAPRPLWKQPAPGGRAHGLAFTDSRTVVALGDEGTAAAYDVATGLLLGRRAVLGTSAALAGCANGQVAIAAGTFVETWTVRGGAMGPRLAHPGAVLGVAFSPGCDLLASASSDGVRVFRLPGGEQVARLGEGEETSELTFLAGRRLVWATHTTLHEQADVLDSAAAPGGWTAPVDIRRLAFAGSRLEAILEGGAVVRFDVSKPAIPPPLPDVTRGLVATEVFISAEDRVEVVFLKGGWISMFDGDTGHSFARLAGMSYPLRSGALSADGRWLAAGSEDRLLRIFDLSLSRSYAGFHPQERSPPLALDGSPRGDLLASLETDGAVRLWDAATGRPRPVLGRHQGKAASLRFSPDGLRLASSGADGLRLWDLGVGAKGPEGGPLGALAWLRAGALAAARGDGSLARRDLAGNWSTLHTHHQHPVASLASSPDGRLLASGDTDGTLLIFDLDEGRVQSRMRTDADPVEVLAFSRDGKRVASGGRGSTIHVWDVASGLLLQDLTEYGTDAVMALDFAPETRGTPAPGALLAGYRGGRLVLWGKGELTPLVTLQPGATMVAGVRFSPDGRRAALLDVNDNLRILPLEADLGPDPLARLMREYKFESAGIDVMRDEVALVPPALAPPENKPDAGAEGP